MVLPSVGRSSGIIIIWDAQVLELVHSKAGTYVVFLKLKSLKNDFVWGLIAFMVQMMII